MVANKMIPSFFTIVLAPAIVAATSLEYYRSAFCDAQSSSFFLDRHTIAKPLLNDKICHQTPARTVAVRLVDALDPACVVLAYDDYACTSLVGSVPTNEQCVAATKAKIGSWQVNCDTTAHIPTTSSSAVYAPGDLKRRVKQRVPSIRDLDSTTTYTSVQRTVTLTLIAPSVTGEISYAVNASSSSNLTATITSLPLAEAALNSTLSPWTSIEYNLTSSLIAAPNASYVMSTLKTVRPSSTATGSSDGTAILHIGGSPSNLLNAQRIMVTVLCGALAILFAALV